MCTTQRRTHHKLPSSTANNTHISSGRSFGSSTTNHYLCAGDRVLDCRAHLITWLWAGGWVQAKELEEKHKITATVGSALSSGMTSLTAALKGSSSKDSLPQVPTAQKR